MSPDHQKKFLSTREVAQLLKVNEKMVYSLITDKGLPATKVTGKWLFPQRTVEEWLETHVVHNQGPAGRPAADDSILLIAGSDDPLFMETLSLFHASRPEISAFYANLGSMGGLKSLRQGRCHIGVCHLLQDDRQEYNFDFAEQEFDRLPVLVNFSRREQGILLQKGNPKKIAEIADLARPDVRIVNRPLGTGTRLLLDYEIARSDISSAGINGYDREIARHIDVGLEIRAGRADAGPAIRAVAGLLDLEFIPLRWERFDLLINKDIFFRRNIQEFLGLLQDDRFRRLAKSFIGYDISRCGKIVYPKTNNQ